MKEVEKYAVPYFTFYIFVVNYCCEGGVETKKKMLNAIGSENYNGVNLFEGTEPLRKGGSQGAPGATSPLEMYAPEDPGVDISSLFSSKW